jgi:uncharacterized protein YcbK (DUF882 family)
MDPWFMVKLELLRRRLGFPLPVTSGFRCVVHNAEVGGGELSAHLEGRAADIAIEGARAVELVRAALGMGFTGIGLRQHGGRRFVHLDDCGDSPDRPRPRIWTY